MNTIQKNWVKQSLNLSKFYQKKKNYDMNKIQMKKRKRKMIGHQSVWNLFRRCNPPEKVKFDPKPGHCFQWFKFCARRLYWQFIGVTVEFLIFRTKESRLCLLQQKHMSWSFSGNYFFTRFTFRPVWSVNLAILDTFGKHIYFFVSR